MVFLRKSKSIAVAEEYRNELLKRKLDADTRVESVDQLAALYHISHRTADKVQHILMDEDFLYRKQGRGTFIKHAPAKEIKIGCTWNELELFHYSEVSVRHTRLVKRAFREADLKFYSIDYKTLLDKEKWESASSFLDGLLLDVDFIDDRTLPQLREFHAPIVVVKKTAEESRLLCSQVMMDWEKIFRVLIPEVNRFRRILIVRADYPNAVFLDELMRRVFTVPEIETVIFDLSENSEDLYDFFSARKNSYTETLFFTFSNRFSEKLRRIYPLEEMPPLIEMDNLEKYYRPSKEHRIFSSVGNEYEQVYCKALDLLKHHILDKDDSRYIVKIPAKLVIRKSFIPQSNNKKEFYYE